MSDMIHFDSSWDIRVTDTSLRDGSHHKRHQFTVEEVRAIVGALDGAGVPVIEVTHGDGLGGSSFNYGFSKTPEQELIKAAVETATNAKIARQLNRFTNVRFRQGLAEEVDRYFPPASFDLVYSFAVLEHVRDVDQTLRAIQTVLRPGGRFAFVVPMHELRATGPIPDYTPIHGYADHCRVFTETELRERFGRCPAFRLVKLPGEWKHGELPACFEPIEFGAFFVSYAIER